MALLVLEFSSLLDQTQISFLRTLLSQAPSTQLIAFPLDSPSESCLPWVHPQLPPSSLWSRKNTTVTSWLLKGQGFQNFTLWCLSCACLPGGPRMTPRWVQHLSTPRNVGLLPPVWSVTEWGSWRKSFKRHQSFVLPSLGLREIWQDGGMLPWQPLPHFDHMALVLVSQHLIPLLVHSLPLPLSHSAPATLVSNLFLQSTRQGPVSGPLHWLFPLSGMLFLQTPTQIIPSFKSLLKCHFLGEDFPHHSILLPCFIFLHRTPRHSHQFNYSSGFSLATTFHHRPHTQRPTEHRGDC